jgi:ABC-2 type transport system ATP-binding protein
MAVFISTAYMDEAARCHEVCLLHQGRVLTQGPPRQLVKQLSAKVFEITGGDRDRVYAKLEGTKGVIATSPAGERLRVVVEVDAAAGLVGAIEPLGVRITEAKADFEDVFLASIESKEREHDAR